MEIKQKNLKTYFEKAGIELKQKQVSGIKAQVGLVLDISKSMNPLFRDGTVQNVIERILALALHFDDDQQIDMFIFGTDAHTLPPAKLQGIEGYAQREIVEKYNINGATRYATALEKVKEFYSKPKLPVFIIFVTDGGNSDKKETEVLLKELSFKPIFFQFVGIGKEDFPFLHKLDELQGRFVDNAGFMHVNDIATIREEELYSRLLNEFPAWLQAARQRKMI